MGDTNAQPALIEGVRRSEPACYDDVVEAMKTGIDNQPELATWDVSRLANDIWCYAYIKPTPELKDVERSIRIWRERNG